MKKILLSTIIILIAVLITNHVALADGGPHGDYTALTDSCAGCHRTHTATGARLLISNNTQSLCMSCHGSTGAGANTNVEDGVYLSSRDDTTGNQDHGAANTPNGSPLLGGGFINFQGYPVTSRHDMAGDGNTLYAWGNEVDRGEVAPISDLEFNCASCHDPHGSPNYRIISTEVNGNEVVIDPVDEDSKDYDTEQWGSGLSSLCAACHISYHETTANVGSNQGSQSYGGGFTHRVDMPYHYRGNLNPETDGFTDDMQVNVRVPLAESGTNDRVVCMTCHLAHGSSAIMSGNAGVGALPGGTNAADSALLRLDNRGICQACHQK